MMIGEVGQLKDASRYRPGTVELDAPERRLLKIQDVNNNFANGGINYLLTVRVNYLLTDSFQTPEPSKVQTYVRHLFCMI